MATITATTPELQASAHNWISAEKAAERNAHCSCRTSPTAIIQVIGGDAAQHNLLPFLPYDLLWKLELRRLVLPEHAREFHQFATRCAHVMEYFSTIELLMKSKLAQGTFLKIQH